MRDSEPVMICEKCPWSSNISMPVVLGPQRSTSVPSLRVLTDDTKLQLPTSLLSDAFPRCPASAPLVCEGTNAAAPPKRAMKSRRSIAFPAVAFFSNSNTKSVWGMAKSNTLLQRNTDCEHSKRWRPTRAARGRVSLRLGRLHTLGGVQRGQNDALIAGAAAKVTGNRDPDLPLGGLGVIAQKFQ